MDYKDQEIIEAYKLYSRLAADGAVMIDEMKAYRNDERMEKLIECFAESDDAVIITAGDMVYIVPKATTSIFHMNNEMIKKLYLSTTATNLDIYLMYVIIIILLGEFYDSYQTQEPTRDFMSMGEWLEAVNNRLESLNQIDKEVLKKAEEEQEYNWTKIIEKWLAIDDLKEKAKRQSGNTASRLSFLDTVKKFLEKQDLIKDIGNEEMALTEKAKIIVQRYYMDYEYNRGILDFMYQMENHEVKGEEV